MINTDTNEKTKMNWLMTMNKYNTGILFLQIVAHLSLVPMVLYGDWYHYLIAIFIYFLSGCLGMTMTYHRLLSHKSWNPPKFIEYLFSLFATIGLTGPAISWVAVHREHHAFTDTEKDPHSPNYKGRFYSHVLSMFIKPKITYAKHLLKDKFYQTQHTYYFQINLLYAFFLYLIDPFAVIYAWLVPAAILWNAGSSIVSLSHRNFSTHNDIILAILVWGEGYHKNHHGNVKSSRFGKVDCGGLLINLLTRKNKNEVN